MRDRSRRPRKADLGPVMGVPFAWSMNSWRVTGTIAGVTFEAAFRAMAFLGAVLVLAPATLALQAPPPPPAVAAEVAPLGPQQLDDLVAPIALYPDPLGTSRGRSISGTRSWPNRRTSWTRSSVSARGARDS